jgi:hypothetical protein
MVRSKPNSTTGHSPTDRAGAPQQAASRRWAIPDDRRGARSERLNERDVASFRERFVEDEWQV